MLFIKLSLSPIYILGSFSRVLWEKGDYKMLMNLEEEGVKLGRAGKWIECEEND